MTRRIHLPVPCKLVYGAHNYAWSIKFGWNIWNGNSGSESEWRSAIYDSWYYLVEQRIGPVWLSEFGSGDQSTWWVWMTKFLNESKMDYAYWPLNGEDGFGMLAADYNTVRDRWRLEGLMAYPFIPSFPSPSPSEIKTNMPTVMIGKDSIFPEVNSVSAELYKNDKGKVKGKHKHKGREAVDLTAADHYLLRSQKELKGNVSGEV